MRKLNFLILKVDRVWCEVDGFRKNICLCFIADLEAGILPESDLLNAASARIDLEGWFYKNDWFLNRGRVEFSPNVWLEHVLENRC